MVMMMSAIGLGQVLDVGELDGVGSVRKVGGELIELVRCGGIALRLGGFGGAFEIRGDLLGKLLILGWVRLLKLLERAHQLGER